MARPLNLNKLAKDVTEQEGGAVSMSIAQVKEVLRITFDELKRNYKMSEVVAAIESR